MTALILLGGIGFYLLMRQQNAPPPLLRLLRYAIPTLAALSYLVRGIDQPDQGERISVVVILAFLAVAVLGYRALLTRLRSRASLVQAEVQEPVFSRITNVTGLTADLEEWLKDAPEPKRRSFGIVKRTSRNEVLSAGLCSLTGQTADLHAIFVDPGARRQGHGKALLQTLEQEALTDGAMRAQIAVTDKSLDGFWSACGYTRTPDPLMWQKDLT